MVLPFSMDLQQARRDRWRNQQSRRRDGEPFLDHILGRASLANIDAARGAGCLPQPVLFSSCSAI
jgi:hypothetical protein